MKASVYPSGLVDASPPPRPPQSCADVTARIGRKHVLDYYTEYAKRFVAEALLGVDVQRVVPPTAPVPSFHPPHTEEGADIGVEHWAHG